MSILKIISSITSFSMMSQKVMGFALNLFRRIGVSQGFWKSCSILVLALIVDLLRFERYFGFIMSPTLR